MRLTLLFLLISTFASATDNPYLKKIAVTKGMEQAREMNNYVNSILKDSSKRALPIALKAVEIASSDQDAIFYYTTLSSLCTVYNDLGLYDSTFAVAERGIRLAKSKNNKLCASYLMVSMADAYKVRGNYEKAIANFLEGIKQGELHNDTTFLGYVYNATGITFFDLKDYEKSIQYLRMGMKMKYVQNNEDRTAEYCLNLGSSYSEMNKQDSAIYFWKKCIALGEKNQYHDMLSAGYNNMAGAYFRLGQYDKTLEYGLKSLHLAEKYNDKHSQMLYNTNIGELYAELGNFEKSFFHIDKGYQLARERGNKRNMAYSYRAYSSVYELKKDFQKSLEYHKRYIELKDSILNEEKSKQISELNATFETEKKQRAIEMLSKESALQKSEVEKQKLLRNSMMGVALMVGGMGLLVFRGYRQKKKANVLLTEQKEQISQQRELLEEKNKDITDSITYGKRIQTALLPDLKMLHDTDHFLLFRPRDIVSGDFYWMTEIAGKRIYVVADCTGHGVPGAFMSMIGISLLNELVKVRKQTDPGAILNALRDGVIQTLSAEGEQVKDGMDISIAVIDKSSNRLHFAGANNSGYLIRKNEGGFILETLNADKMPVGNYLEEQKDFTTLTIDIQNGDRLFLFSDGFVDQFGGPQGKKFRAKQFKEVLIEQADKSVAMQGQHLEKRFLEWKGGMEQVDDVCVFGVEV